MNRREFLANVAAGITFLPSVLRAGDHARPNMVVVLIDDMGWCDTGFSGSEYIKTPNADRLAKSGIIFSQAYAAAPNCAPTRACLMTGQYAPRHGVYTVVDERHAPGSAHHKIVAADSKAELATGSYTIAEALRDAGYTTGMVGMWNLGRGRRGPTTPLGQGFESYVQPKDMGFDRDAYFNSEGEYLADAMTDAGIEFVQKAGRKPFFLYLAYHSIHSPFDPKPELLAKYEKITGSRDEAEYAATVEALDVNLGRLDKALADTGHKDDTYLLFTSDNGGTHQYVSPLRGGKGSLYEGGLRVPSFVTGPGIKGGRVTSEPVSTIDIYPTLLDLAGVSKPDGHPLDGLSLVALMKGETEKLNRDELFWHFPCYIGRSGPASAIRFGHYKLIQFFEDSSFELYDLKNDAEEKRNLVHGKPEMAARLKSRLAEWHKELNAPCPNTRNPDYDPGVVRNKSRDGRGKGGGKRKDKR